MSGECKPSIQNNGECEASLESYRCNSCSIDFNLVEHLIEHTHEVHTQDLHSPGRGVTCGKCQLEFADISEFIEHHRNVHLDDTCVNGNVHVEHVCAEDDDVDDVDLGEDHVKLEHQQTPQVISDGESVPMDDSDIPDQITIVNDNGETIGVAEGDEVEGGITGDLHGNHMGTAPSHISTYTSYQGQNLTTSNANRKRRLPAKFRDLLHEPESWKRETESAVSPESKANQVEIDVTGITNIRLKTKNDNSREEEIIQYLMRVEEKLDCIIKHFNVPFNSEPPQRINALTNIMGKPGAFKKAVPYRTPVHVSTLQPLHVSIPRRQSTQTPGNPSANRATHDVSYIQCDQSQTLPEVTQYVISDELLEATYMKSRNRGNFAKNLVYAAFPLEERLGRNCYGRRGGSLSGPKDPLEPAKLEAVCEAVFKKFPVLDGDDPDVVWKRECVIAIDTALRSEMRTRILNMQNTIKGEMMRTTMKTEMKNIGMNITM